MPVSGTNFLEMAAHFSLKIFTENLKQRWRGATKKSKYFLCLYNVHSFSNFIFYGSECARFTPSNQQSFFLE